MKKSYLLGLLFILIIVFSLTPKISGSLNDVRFYAELDSLKTIPVSAVITKETDSNLYSVTDGQGNTGIVAYHDGYETGKNLIYYLRYNKTDNKFIVTKTENNTFFFTFPFIPGLEEKARIILFHVPVAWVSVLAFLVSMIFGIKYLRSNQIEFDTKSANAAALGFMFCVLATVTGSIWAKFSWGSFWNWDPRETSIFMLLLIYTSYFALRSAVENKEKRAKLSSVYSIIAFTTVPFFIFILPRITAGLHPGSADDMTSPSGGPVIRSGMSAEMRVVFYFSLLAFTLFFWWLLNLRNRTSKLELIHKEKLRG